MSLAVFAVLWSEPEEVPVLPALVQVVADGVQLVLGPAAGHDAQRLAELRSQPGLYGGEVSGSDDQYRLIVAWMEHGDRGCRAGAGEVTEVIGEPDVAAASGCGPAAVRGRTRGRHPAGMRRRLRDRRVLPFDPELLSGPGTGHGGPALHPAILLETGCHGAEVGACHPDRPLPHGPDPALQASRLGDRKGWLKPVTQAVSHQAASRSCPVAVAHDEPVNIHMAR